MPERATPDNPIRTELGAGETLNDDGLNYKKLFLGSCYGVALSPRGENDRHVVFTILVHDDGQWFIPRAKTGTSFWLMELGLAIVEAVDWLNANCEEDGSGYGWNFPE